MSKQEAYRIVYEDMMLNDMFNGSSPLLNNLNPHFIEGYTTVMSILWLHSNLEGRDYDSIFEENRRKAKR